MWGVVRRGGAEAAAAAQLPALAATAMGALTPSQRPGPRALDRQMPRDSKGKAGLSGSAAGPAPTTVPAA